MLLKIFFFALQSNSWQSDFPIPPRTNGLLKPPREPRFGGHVNRMFNSPANRLEDGPVIDMRTRVLDESIRDRKRNIVDSPRPVIKHHQTRHGNLNFQSAKSNRNLPSLLSTNVAPPKSAMNNFNLKNNQVRIFFLLVSNLFVFLNANNNAHLFFSI